MEKKSVVCFGEVLWDHMQTGSRIGGAPLNVCYHLSKLGLSSHIISMVGDDEAGRRLLREIEQLGLDTAYCGRHPSAATSDVFVKFGSDNDVSYEIVKDVAWDYIPLTDRLEGLVADADALVYGTLAARSPVSRQTLLALIKDSKSNIMDINLRGDFYSRESVFTLIEWSDLLKINDDEIRTVADWLGVDARPRSVVSAIFARFPRLKEVILTKGARGATYYDREGKIKVPAKDILVKNTVGSGDAFLAGFLAERLKGQPVTQALDTAVALSAFVAQHEGACPEYTTKELFDQSV